MIKMYTVIPRVLKIMYINRESQTNLNAILKILKID